MIYLEIIDFVGIMLFKFSEKPFEITSINLPLFISIS